MTHDTSHPDTVADVARIVGKQELADALGVSTGSITQAIRQNRMPASWFVVAMGLLSRHGIECPSELFSFKAKPDAY